MLKLDPFEVFSLPAAVDAARFELEFFGESLYAFARQQEFACRSFGDDVLKIRMKCEARLAGRVQGVVVQMSAFTSAAKRARFRPGDDGELHPDRRAGVILVLDFSFGECGAVVDAPVDRLQPAIHVTLLEKVEERPGDATPRGPGPS